MTVGSTDLASAGGEKLRRILLLVLALAIATELVLTILLIPEFDLTGAVVLVFVTATGSVGVVLVARLPKHPIGWLLAIAALGAATGALAVTYGELALIDYPGPLPMSHWVIWVGEWAFLVAIAMLSTFLLLLFPTGRPLSPRWMFVLWLATVSVVLMGASRVLSPESFVGSPIPNPLARDDSDLILLIVEGGGFYLFVLTSIISFSSVFVRYRRATGIERQQLKLAVFGMLVATLGLVGPSGLELANGNAEIPAEVENFLVMLALTVVPVAIGLAVLRYRLYDIDRIISRAVSYALVVGLLAALFAVGVVLIPNALPGLEDSPLLVAASTLIVAALFNPMRKRVLHVVDRRFNRSRYNAERVMESFVGSLREKVDRDRVVDNLLEVVSETMQPASAAIWVRDWP